MNSEEQETRTWILAYLSNSEPIHWVNWVAQCDDVEAKALLNSILFEGQGLRDLTDARVRAEVLEAIQQSPAIMEIVIKHLAVNIDETHAKA